MTIFLYGHFKSKKKSEGCFFFNLETCISKRIQLLPASESQLAKPKFFIYFKIRSCLCSDLNHLIKVCGGLFKKKKNNLYLKVFGLISESHLLPLVIRCVFGIFILYWTWVWATLNWFVANFTSFGFYFPFGPSHFNHLSISTIIVSK